MEEKIVEFKLAKIAKDKGFSVGGYDEYTQYHEEYIYDEGPKHPELHVKDEIRFNDGWYHKNLEESCDFSNEYYTSYEAPTQSLLQKWFIDEHNILVVPEPSLVESGNSRGLRYTWYIVKQDLTTVEDSALLGYSTYEEALEVGLEEAFKLI